MRFGKFKNLGDGHFTVHPDIPGHENCDDRWKCSQWHLYRVVNCSSCGKPAIFIGGWTGFFECGECCLGRLNREWRDRKIYPESELAGKLADDYPELNEVVNDWNAYTKRQAEAEMEWRKKHDEESL